MSTNFSISNVLAKSWKALVSQFWILAGLMIAYTIISFAISAFSSGSSPIFNMLASIISLFISIMFKLGYTQNMFEALDEEEPQFDAYTKQFRNFLNALGASLLIAFGLSLFLVLYFVIAFVAFGHVGLETFTPQAFFELFNNRLLTGGFLVLLIPVIYIGLRIQFYIMFIVEEDAGIIESIKKSWAITEGNVLKLFLLFLLIFGIIIAGFICLIVGVFVAIPLVSVMECAAYRALKNGANTEYKETVEDF